MRVTATMLSSWTAVLLSVCLAGPALASGGSSGGSGGSTRSGQSAGSYTDADYEQAKKAIADKDWTEAVRLLQRAEARQESNADIANLLGFAERNRGNMDAAFAHYERALRLDPGHRGAHEYVGEAYLMVGNLIKAEEHLTQLGKLCGSSCEEFADLQKSIQNYKRTHSE